MLYSIAVERNIMSNNHFIKANAGKGNYIWNGEELEILSKILLNFKNTRELSDFLIDLLTSREIAEITRRLLIAYAITKGFTFKLLEEKCNVYSHTVSQLRKKIYFGKGKLREVLENSSIKKIDEEFDKLLDQRINSKKEYKDFKPVIYGHKYPKT